MIRASLSVTASPCRPYEIIISVMTVDIGSLRESPCYLPRLAPRFQCKTVRGQFNAINAAKTAPEKIVRTIDRDIADILCGIEVNLPSSALITVGSGALSFITGLLYNDVPAIADKEAQANTMTMMFLFILKFNALKT